MRRRDIVRLGLLASAATISSLGRAHQTIPAVRIGVLLPVPENASYLVSLQDGLRDVGWTDRSAFSLEIRSADGTIVAFHRLGRELVALGVDVLVTASTAAATALAQETATIPIVFVGTFDPVAAGLVAKMEHPGRNVTGIAGFQTDVAGKWVSQLKEIAPGVVRIAILSNPASVSSAALAGWKVVASRSADIRDAHVDTVADIDRVVADVAKDPQSGMIVVPHTFTLANRKVVVTAMAAHKVPAIYGVAEMVRSGGLLSYGQDLAAQWRMSSVYIDKIVHGAKPADLPAQYATKYTLALNRAAAKALGLDIPTAMIERAAELIE